jgi:nucleoside-diphosphate-sugar epimerase
VDDGWAIELDPLGAPLGVASALAEAMRDSSSKPSVCVRCSTYVVLPREYARGAYVCLRHVHHGDAVVRQESSGDRCLFVHVRDACQVQLERVGVVPWGCRSLVSGTLYLTLHSR